MKIDLEEASSLWHDGWRECDIAARYGVTRQSVAHHRYSHPEMFGPRLWASRTAAARMIDTDSETITRWFAAGVLRESPSGLVYLPDVEVTAEALYTRQCEYPDCTAEVESLYSLARFCPPHRVEAARYRYPVLTEEARARAKASMNSWRERNPERAREIQNRATRKYRAKRLENTP